MIKVSKSNRLCVFFEFLVRFSAFVMRKKSFFVLNSIYDFVYFFFVDNFHIFSRLMFSMHFPFFRWIHWNNSRICIHGRLYATLFLSVMDDVTTQDYFRFCKFKKKANEEKVHVTRHKRAIATLSLFKIWFQRKWKEKGSFFLFTHTRKMCPPKYCELYHMPLLLFLSTHSVIVLHNNEKCSRAVLLSANE